MELPKQGFSNRKEKEGGRFVRPGSIAVQANCKYDMNSLVSQLLLHPHHVHFDLVPSERFTPSIAWKDTTAEVIQEAKVSKLARAFVEYDRRTANDETEGLTAFGFLVSDYSEALQGTQAPIDRV